MASTPPSAAPATKYFPSGEKCMDARWTGILEPPPRITRLIAASTMILDEQKCFLSKTSAPASTLYTIKLRELPMQATYLPSSETWGDCMQRLCSGSVISWTDNLSCDVMLQVSMRNALVYITTVRESAENIAGKESRASIRNRNSNGCRESTKTLASSCASRYFPSGLKRMRRNVFGNGGVRTLRNKTPCVDSGWPTPV